MSGYTGICMFVHDEMQDFESWEPLGSLKLFDLLCLGIRHAMLGNSTNLALIYECLLPFVD